MYSYGAKIMNPTYDKILDAVKLKENFNFGAYKLPMLIRRIDNRILKTNSKSPEQYLFLLNNQSQESKALLSNFLINVSHFFRNPFVFEYLRIKVIPELFSTALSQGQNSIRIWSAGCAAGEEAYSLSILLNEYLAKEKLEIGVDFFATDYDETVLELAKEACYRSDHLDEVKLKYVNKYFQQDGDNFTLTPEIKSKVRFSKYNLLDENSYAPSESIFGGFDIVLCRNVLIYFQEEAQNRIFEKLYKSLLPGKFLFLGEAEMPSLQFQNKFHQINDCCKIYRKTGNEN